MREIIGAEHRHMNPFKSQRRVRRKDFSVLSKTSFKGLFRWRRY